jgi:GDP-L-fucose synthase
MAFDLTGKRIWVAGHNGMVGRALLRALARKSCEVLTVERRALDLRDQDQTEAWIDAHRPDAIFIAAAKVGGIAANVAQPAAFIYDNLSIGANIIHAAYRAKVRKLLFLGSSCIYPKLAPMPITEDALLTSPLEPTNEYYAIAKIAGLRMRQAYRKQYSCDFISAMPTNLYGPYDHFEPEFSHVVPGLIYKLHQAKIRQLPFVTVWGTGTPRREFLHVDDLAAALVLLLRDYSGAEPINVGCGTDISIRELATLLAEIIGFKGELRFDPSRPDGTPRKLLDISKISRLGWKPSMPLAEGLAATYDWYVRNQ